MSTNSNKEIRWLLSEKYGGKETAAFKKDLARLKKGEPVDYVIGWKPFLGCKIDLSLKPLIPRPETEYWVEQAIKEIDERFGYRRPYRQTISLNKKAEPDDETDKRYGPPQRQRDTIHCLDLFAGSGCIGIALLKHLPSARVDFGERDKKAIRQIEKNLKANNIHPLRANVIRADVFSRITGQYDYIFANPPYIDASRPKLAQASVRKWEPRDALFAKRGGFYYIERLIADAPKFLVPGGMLYMEFGAGQKTKIEKLLKGSAFASWKFQRDQYGKWRMLAALRD